MAVKTFQVDESKIKGSVKGENLSHSVIRWVEGGENSRVELRDGGKLIGHVWKSEVEGRIHSQDLSGVVRSHKSAFHAARALENFAGVNPKDLKTHKVASKDYRERKAAFKAAKKAAA